MNKLFTVSRGHIVVVCAVCLGGAQGVFASEGKTVQKDINFLLATSLSIPQRILACLPEFIRPSTARVHAGVSVSIPGKTVDNLKSFKLVECFPDSIVIKNEDTQKTKETKEKIKKGAESINNDIEDLWNKKCLPLWDYITQHYIVGLSGLWKKDKFPVGMGRFRPEKLGVGVLLQDGSRDIEVSTQVTVGKKLWPSQWKNFRPYQTYGKAQAVVPTAISRNLHGCSAEVGAKWDENIMPECIGKTWHPDTKLSAKFSQKDGVILRAAMRLKRLQCWNVTPKMMVELKGRGALLGVSLSSDGNYDNNADNDDLIAPTCCSRTFKFK